MGGDGVSFWIHVRPGGRRNAVEGAHGDAVAVRVVAPPAGGKANSAVIALLAELFGVASRDMTIESGYRSRRKLVRIAGDQGRIGVMVERLFKPEH